MKNILIVKLNATGDVVRTTPLLHRLDGEVTWITAPVNLPLLAGVSKQLRAIAWEDRFDVSKRRYDLLINLEDERETACYAKDIRANHLFGAYLDSQDQMRYTDDARGWFDLSLISRFGRVAADRLKFRNRRSYQDLVFEGLGWKFANERYLLPPPPLSDLAGDVAIAPIAGPVWPMKNWAYYGELQQQLEQRRLRVNMLPRRATLLEHLGDIRNHKCVVGGDSLPMHLALGLGVRCVTIFNCTSPWEIFDYGLQTKIVSPLLEEFFYKRESNTRATMAVQLHDVLAATLAALES
jgi:ADP-heptose:LPS heptosyltransferase